jgi:ribosome maturation factor RimP
MGLEQQISTLAEGKLAKSSHFIVDVVVSARKGPKKILVIMDGDQGVSIDDCANVSRELSKTFDELALFEDSFLLEVSTPGVDYPLKMKRQYHKHIGRKLRVKLEERTVEGKLESVGEETITLQEETGTGKKKQTISISINFPQIEKAFVLVSFK